MKLEPISHSPKSYKLSLESTSCKFKTLPSTILKFLDITRHTNGSLLLKIIFWLHCSFTVAATFGHVYEVSNQYLIYKRSPTEEQYRTLILCLVISIWGVGVLAKCSTLLFLARRKDENLRYYLRWYTIWNSIVLVPTIAFLEYMKFCLLSPKAWSNWGWDEILHVSLYTTLVLFKTYLIVLVVLIYRKLGSTLITRLKEYQKVDFESKEQDLDPLHSVPTNYGGLKCLNPPATDVGIDIGVVGHSKRRQSVRISNDMFQDRIISPLCISIDASKFVGEGQFGSVYKGTFRRKGFAKIEVAAKVVKNPEQGETFKLLLQEIKIAIFAGEHNNIVKFYGITSDASLNAHFAIITDFCEMGSLEDFLQTNRHTFVNMLREKGNIIYKDQQLYINLELHGTHSSIDLIRFAHQLALGMGHLASRKIIHGDLAARNVLLTSDLTIKLSDFGMSRRLYNYQQYFRCESDQKCFPWRWMSFEAIRDLKFSPMSDVWSYGIVLWEIFSLGSFPFEKVTWSPDILQQIQNGLRLDRPAFATLDIYQVMQRCWALNPRRRPEFKELAKLFEDQNTNTTSFEVVVKT